MNCPEKKTGGGGGGSFRESTNQKSGKCHELPRKSIHLFDSPPMIERGRGGWEGGDREGDREGERETEAGREGGARAKPGNQLVIYMKLRISRKKNHRDVSVKRSICWTK